MFYDRGMCPVRVLCAYLQSSGCSRTKGRPVRERIVVIIVGRWRLMCMRVYGVCVCVLSCGCGGYSGGAYAGKEK